MTDEKMCCKMCHFESQFESTNETLEVQRWHTKTYESKWGIFSDGKERVEGELYLKEKPKMKMGEECPYKRDL